MSRINRSANNSPLFRSERPFRSATVPPTSSENEQNNHTNNTLLSENQLSNVK